MITRAEAINSNPLLPLLIFWMGKGKVRKMVQEIEVWVNGNKGFTCFYNGDSIEFAIHNYPKRKTFKLLSLLLNLPEEEVERIATK